MMHEIPIPVVAVTCRLRAAVSLAGSSKTCELLQCRLRANPSLRTIWRQILEAALPTPSASVWWLRFCCWGPPPVACPLGKAAIPRTRPTSRALQTTRSCKRLRQLQFRLSLGGMASLLGGVGRVQRCPGSFFSTAMFVNVRLAPKTLRCRLHTLTTHSSRATLLN